jgi:NAD(P)-dependent dehydrogenase (short-subunit alcohol dehydrogenase family)
VTDELFDLTDRVSIVTGGGTGIGAATARMLAEHGAHRWTISSYTAPEGTAATRPIAPQPGAVCQVPSEHKSRRMSSSGHIVLTDC